MSLFFPVVHYIPDVDYGAPDDEFLDVLCFHLPLGQDRAKVQSSTSSPPARLYRSRRVFG